MSESRLIQYLIAVPDGKASKKGKLLKAHAGQGIIRSWEIDGATIRAWIDGTGSVEPPVRQVEALERIAAALEKISANRILQIKYAQGIGLDDLTETELGIWHLRKGIDMIAENDGSYTEYEADST